MPCPRMDNTSESINQIKPRIRESGTKNNETDNSIVISKTFCKWNPAICIHDKPLLGITCNNHLKLACLYSEDGICFFFDQNLQPVTKLSTQFFIKHALLLDTHLILCNSNGSDYEIVSISLLTNQQSSVLFSSSMVIGLFAIDAYYRGFVMIDVNGNITFFAPENDRWKVDCTHSLGMSVELCDVKDNWIYCCSKDNAIQILDIRTGTLSSIKTNHSSIIYICPVEYKDELVLFTTTKTGYNTLYSIASGLLVAEHHEKVEYENSCICRVPGKGYAAIQSINRHTMRTFSLLLLPRLNGCSFGYKLKPDAVCMRDISDFVGRPCCALLRKSGSIVTFDLQLIVY